MRASRKGDCRLTRDSSAIWAWALFATQLLSSTSTSGELEELSVSETDGEYRLRIVSVLDAPADYVYKIITDYKHAYRINPSISEVEILPTDRDEVVRVRNLSEHWVGPFCFRIDWVGDIQETTEGDIKIITVPELSSFQSGAALWEIRPRGERTWLLHESRLKPDFFIPPLIGEEIMKNKMETDALATVTRIECHAMIMFERDMENETEQLKTLSKEGRDCIKPGESAELMHH